MGRCRAEDQSLVQCQQKQKKVDAAIKERAEEIRSSLQSQAVDSESDGRCREARTPEHICQELDQNSSQLSAYRLKEKVLDEKLKNAPAVDEESVVAKQAKLRRFTAHAAKVRDAIANLEDGIKSTQERAVAANEVALDEVGKHFRRIFASAVPRKVADIRSLDDCVEVSCTSFFMTGILSGTFERSPTMW